MLHLPLGVREALVKKPCSIVRGSVSKSPAQEGKAWLCNLNFSIYSCVGSTTQWSIPFKMWIFISKCFHFPIQIKINFHQNT